MSDHMNHPGAPIGPAPTAEEHEKGAADLLAARAALRKAVRDKADVLAAARLLLDLAEVATKVAGVPLGSTAIDIAQIALEEIAEA